MRATCCICADVLDEVHSISATSCGHVYHSNCLMLWIGQRKTCPICRSAVNITSVLKLYFDFPTTPADNSSILENEVLNLKACISAKAIELEACRKERDMTKVYVREAERKAADLQQTHYGDLCKIADLTAKVKSIVGLESAILKLEKRNDSLTNELQILNNIQAIVHGTQKDVDSMLRECGKGCVCSKQMATYCAVLKRELQKVIESKNNLLELNSKLKQENCRFAAKVKFYEDAMALSSKNDNSSCEKSTKFQKQVGLASNSRSAELNSPASTAKVSSPGKTGNQNNPDVSPLSVPFNKSKFTMRIVASSSTSHKIETTTEVEKYTSVSSVTIKKRSDDGSIIRTGYNGLGGHSNFINTSSGIKKMKISKK